MIIKNSGLNPRASARICDSENRTIKTSPSRTGTSPVFVIDRGALEKVAQVARLPLTEEELQQFLPEVGEVLEAFKTLQGVDTVDVEPSFHPVEVKDVLRDDSPEDCLSQEEALSLTSHKKDGYFKGPKAV